MTPPIERGRQHEDVVWLDCIGGPAHGHATFPYGVAGQTRQTPRRGEQVQVLNGNTRAVYVWDEIAAAFVCRFEEERG